MKLSFLHPYGGTNQQYVDYFLLNEVEAGDI